MNRIMSMKTKIYFISLLGIVIASASYCYKWGTCYAKNWSAEDQKNFQIIAGVLLFVAGFCMLTEVTDKGLRLRRPSRLRPPFSR